MDKKKEREQLQRVFGEKSRLAIDHERPDFLLEISGDFSLGVEVTSIYASNADAKLKLIPGYSGALIDRTGRVHKSDVDTIRVEEATFLNPDGSVLDTVTGIFQEMPSKKRAYEILFTKTAAKEAKLNEYLLNCAEVDLIVEDGSHLLNHETHEEFYECFHLLAPKKTLIQSGFREIHLITTAAKEKVYIPLIASAFFADCYAYEHLLVQDSSNRTEHEIFLMLLACLWHDGYQRVRVNSGAHGFGISCGAWEIFYSDDAINLRDWNFPGARYLGETLADVVADMTGDAFEEARSLSEARQKCFSARDIRRPVHKN